ncbi:hypothetical protein ACE2AJ_09735 [Aquihabitans daechungensis]|uniref:hypothetical protein n=1 Tax=Aquihabitans daechungensis TaxID=1052257 RepID=UPI003BA096F4
MSAEVATGAFTLAGVLFGAVAPHVFEVRANAETYALAVNALALNRHRHSSGDPPLPLAA